MIRRNGRLPVDAPAFAQFIAEDLADYGFSLLDAGLELRAQDRGHTHVRSTFRLAGRVFEALVKHGDPDSPERGFHRIIAAASYHIAGYAAMAFALFSNLETDGLNLNAGEQALVLLILRDLEGVRSMSRNWLEDPAHGDGAIAAALVEGETSRDDALGVVVLTGLFRALAYFEFALQTGDVECVDTTHRFLDAAYGLAGEAGLVALWWIVRLARDLLDDLWSHSLHQLIPHEPVDGTSQIYSTSRRIFIAGLFDRDVSQVELWPSQVAAARRVADSGDDLVVSLPTSAGKTRIAELAALTCLAQSKRVLLITPLRALSAQTERVFRSTFATLGATVSSLYGKSGLSDGDSHALASDKIVVSTPEKLDFALRSDPEIISDVGLIVLDEGHMIGPDEREIRFEILVQRLLRRKDADGRRIICLSAILPEDQDLDDVTAWIRTDAPGDPVRSEWRPTEQRYGTLEWRGDRGTLRYDLQDDGPFVSRFLSPMAAITPERKPRPRDIKDVTLMGAWRFAEENKRTLIFVTQANWVEGFAERALDLVRRGHLTSLLDDVGAIKEAETIGREWLGEDHPAVACLKIGLAVHHRGLPSPFLREVERLLSTGVILVTAASPTLAQGLNLNAAALLVPYLVRSGKPISSEEFANVAGRAGRAFVDTEGLILHVIMDDHAARKTKWCRLIERGTARSLRSGLMLLIDQVVRRLSERGVPKSEEGYKFLANAREDWLVETEGSEAKPPLSDLIPRLDGIIFGLIEALAADADTLPELLDEALAGSLWARQMEQLDPRVKQMQLIVLRARARLIWNNTTPVERKGHFAMGVGLDAGLALDALAESLEASLDQADRAAHEGDLETLHEALSALGTQLLTVKPFVPDAELPRDWSRILRLWLSGAPIAAIGDDYMGLIEDAFVYRLVWAIEAMRTRRVAHGWEGGDLAADGMAAACLDTGLPDYRMSMLVRAGLASREAALRAVGDFDPAIADTADLRRWLRSDEIAAVSERGDWPTPETTGLWRRFRADMLQDQERRWTITESVLGGLVRPQGTDAVFRIERGDGNSAVASTPDYEHIAQLDRDVGNHGPGLVYGKWRDDGLAVVTRIGPPPQR